MTTPTRLVSFVYLNTAAQVAAYQLPVPTGPVVLLCGETLSTTVHYRTEGMTPQWATHQMGMGDNFVFHPVVNPSNPTDITHVLHVEGLSDSHFPFNVVSVKDAIIAGAGINWADMELGFRSLLEDPATGAATTADIVMWLLGEVFHRTPSITESHMTATQLAESESYHSQAVMASLIPTVNNPLYRGVFTLSGGVNVPLAAAIIDKLRDKARDALVPRDDGNPLGFVMEWDGHYYGLSMPLGYQYSDGSLITDPRSPMVGQRTLNRSGKTSICEGNNGQVTFPLTVLAGSGIGTNYFYLGLSQLPNAVISGTTDLKGAHTPSGSVKINTNYATSGSGKEGFHAPLGHPSYLSNDAGSSQSGSGYEYPCVNSNSAENSGWDDLLHNHSATFTGDFIGNHNHIVTSRLNGDVTQQVVDITPRAVSVRKIVKVFKL